MDYDIQLVAFSQDHFQQTFAWICDPELRRMFLMRGEPDWEGHVTYCTRLLSDSSQKVYAIYCENEHVGNCGIKNIIAGSEGELWIYMGSPATRGKGVGTRATKLLVQEGMENMHFHKMYLHVADFNKAAYAMYQNIGFVEVPLVGDAGVWAGRGCNIIGMELTRS